MRIKKLLVLALSFLFAFTLIACNNGTEDTVLTTTSEEQAALAVMGQAADLITFTNADDVTANFELRSNIGAVTIAWESNNETVISIANATSVNTVQQTVYAASVTIPTLADATVVITGTFSYGGFTYEREYSLTVKAVALEMSYSSIAALHAGAAKTDVITIRGYVYSLYQYGYFIIDASNVALAVYFNSPDSELLAAVEIGDEVIVTGTYGSYQTLYQLSNPTVQLIVSHGNNVDVVKTTLDNATGLTALDSTDKTIHGKIYTITVTVTAVWDTVNSEYDVSLYSGATKIAEVYYRSNVDAIEALAALDGQVVTIDVLYYCLHSVNGIYVTVMASDADRIAADAAALTFDDIIYYEQVLHLPKTGASGSTIIWTADNNTAVTIETLADEFKLTVGTTDVNFTLTASLSLNDETLNKPFTVNIEPLVMNTFAEVYTVASGTVLYLEGIVTGFNGTDGTFIQSIVEVGQTPIGIYVNTYLDETQVGNQVTIRGTVGVVPGLSEDYRFINDDATVIGNDAAAHTVITKEVTGASLSTLAVETEATGTILNITNVEVAKYEGGYIFFEIATDIYLKAEYVETWVPEVYLAGMTISELELFILKVDGANLVAINLDIAELNNAQKLIVDASLFDLEQTITSDIEIPTLEYSTIESVTISAGLTDYVTYASGVFTITRPASDASDAMGTVTITLELGVETKNVVINITVTAASEINISDLFISEYVEGSSYFKYIEIYNGTGTTIDLSEYSLVLYSNGATTATTTTPLSGTLESGHVIVLYNPQAATIPSGQSMSVSAVNFNGDDAVELRHNDVVIDAIGQVGYRPASGYWGDGTTISTQDMTLIRKPNVTSGRTDSSSIFDPSLEWIAYSKDDLTHLGSHTIE